MTILEKLFGKRKPREKSLRERTKEVLAEGEKERMLREKEWLESEPTTLSQVMARYGKVVPFGEGKEYLDKGYASIHFVASMERAVYEFSREDYDFKITSGLEGVIDSHRIVDILGKMSNNKCCGKGAICQGNVLEGRVLVPMESLESLDENYLKRVEDVEGVATRIFYPCYPGVYRDETEKGFSFRISLEAFSKGSKRLLKIVRRDARIADAKIQELKKNLTENKDGIIREYQNHPLIDPERKAKLCGLLRKIPAKTDVAREYEGLADNYSIPIAPAYTHLIWNLTKELEEAKKQKSKNQREFELRYGELKEDSDETTSRLYNERKESWLENDNRAIESLAYRRMKILDSLSDYCIVDDKEGEEIKSKIKTNGIRSLTRNEWKKYYSTYRAMKRR